MVMIFSRFIMAIMAAVICCSAMAMAADVELDVDNNGALDLNRGGTNATTAAGARSALGLGNVDNTSDADKPVSTAVQSALNSKIDSVQGGTNVTVDTSDPHNPIVNVPGGTDDQTASEVPFTPNGSIEATDVQAAIQEVRDEATGTDDQTAAEVPFSPNGSIEATDVQAAIQEVRDEAVVDLTAPGPIGSTTPSEGHFTSLDASSFNFGDPSPGETGEVIMPEDPDNGTNVTGWKAPASLASDIVFIMPTTDGSMGQALITDGSLHISFSDVLTPSSIGTTVQGWDADIDDLADGSLSGDRIGPGIDAANITTGTLPAARIDSAIARLVDVTMAPVSVPTSATDTCTAGSWSYDDSFLYVCVAQDAWRRVGISTW